MSWHWLKHTWSNWSDGYTKSGYSGLWQSKVCLECNLLVERGCERW